MDTFPLLICWSYLQWIPSLFPPWNVSSWGLHWSRPSQPVLAPGRLLGASLLCLMLPWAWSGWALVLLSGLFTVFQDDLIHSSSFRITTCAMKLPRPSPRVPWRSLAHMHPQQQHPTPALENPSLPSHVIRVEIPIIISLLPLSQCWVPLFISSPAQSKFSHDSAARRN